ncbi:MAG: hypothetical protein ACK5LY_00505 [Lachnospirales bacterium]
MNINFNFVFHNILKYSMLLVIIFINDYTSITLFAIGVITYDIFEIINKRENKDVIYSLGMKRSTLFNSLLLKTAIITIIPLIDIIYSYSNVTGSFVLSFDLILWCIAIVLIVVSFCIFINVISASFALPILTFLVILIFLGFLNKTNYFVYSKEISIIIILLSTALILLSKILMKYRLAEKLGRLFMFRSAEIFFATIVSASLGAILTFYFGNINFFEPFTAIFGLSTNNIGRTNAGVIGNIIFFGITLLSYTILNCLFLKDFNFKKILKNSVQLVFPTIGYLVVIIIIVFWYQH